QVPVPQSAAAAVERGVDPAAHRVVDEIAFACPGRLPVEGEAEDQYDKTGGGGQRHGQRRVRSPEGIVPFLDDDDPAGQRFYHALDRHRVLAVGKDDVGRGQIGR